jgi:integrase
MAEVLSEILSEYQAQFGKREFSNLRSILKRRILPNLLKLDGLQHLQDKKLDYIFEHIPLAGFVVTADPIFQSQILQLPRSNACNVERSQWKRFCTWLQAHKEYVPVPVPLVSEKAPPTYTHIPKGTLKAVVAFKEKKEQQAKPFSLLERDWSPNLRTKRQSFDYFCQTVTQWRRQAIAPATLDFYHQDIERVLGFRKTVQGVALEALAITDLLDLSVLQAYEQWSRNRGLASYTIRNDLAVAIPIAQWQFHQSAPNENYKNPEPVETIRVYLRSIVDHGDRPRVSDEAYAAREVTKQQCWEILAYLGWRCKDLEKQHGITSEVIDAWMDYLIIALLVTTGGRQREIREMRRQQLSLEENGLIIATLPPEGHKTGRKTGKGREYPLFVGPMQLTLGADLWHYLEHIRPQDLNHDFLFFVRQNRSTQNGQFRRGEPICGQGYLSNRVSSLMACVTAHLYGMEHTKWTAPHDFRRIIATWVCTYGEPKHLAIFAELLGTPWKCW